MTEVNTDKPKPTFELVLSRQYDMEILADTIITAVEGGINYWCEVVSYTHTEGAEHTRAMIVISDELKDKDDSDQYYIDCDVARRGIERILNGNVPISSTIIGYIMQSLDENSAFMIDADAADCIIQAGLFNELRFG